MTTLSAAIKKELKQAFPGIKFSVTTSRMDNISVKWELEIGTAATKDAVSEICKKHETVEHHGSNIDDTSWYSGFSVYINPTCTQERKDWAVKATEARNFVGVVWNETYKHFQEADGRDAFHATKQYREYCDNGVTSDLVDKYGQEPNAKRWHYERLAKETQIEAPATEPKIIKPESVEPPQEIIIPVIIEPIAPETDTEKCVRVAKEIWPTMFDAKEVESCIEDNATSITPAAPETLKLKPETVDLEIESLTLNCLVATNRCRIKVTDVRTETVTGQLLDDRDNLILEYGRPVFACIRKSEILSLSEQPQPEPEILPLPVPETNLIPFPSPKQPEPQPAAQPQSDGRDGFYLQSYQAWVNKLVVRGEYGKIKSFDEWYVIAVEVM